MRKEIQERTPTESIKFEDWRLQKGALTASVSSPVADHPHHLSVACQAFVLAVNEAVYGAEPSIHEDDEEGVPDVPFGTRQAAAELILDLARFIALESHAPWEIPHVAITFDGRMSLAWENEDGRVTVYVPPSEDGNYVIVTKTKGAPAQRVVDNHEHVSRHLRNLLCKKEETLV